MNYEKLLKAQIGIIILAVGALIETMEFLIREGYDKDDLLLDSVSNLKALIKNKDFIGQLTSTEKAIYKLYPVMRGEE